MKERSLASPKAATLLTLKPNLCFAFLPVASSGIFPQPVTRQFFPLSGAFCRDAPRYLSIRTMSPATLQAPFRLLDLPPELIGNVCEHLADPDLKRIRGICRVLKAQSSATYGQCFFNHLIVVLHPISLMVFLEIARHPELSKYVTRVSISGERLSQHTSWPVDDWTMHTELQRSVQTSGLDVLILKEALLALENIKTIRIDTEQFFCGTEAGNHHHIGIGCGRTLMFKISSSSPLLGNHVEDNGISHVYQVVLQVLESIHLRIQVELEVVAFWAAQNDEDRLVQFFDVQSKIWKEHSSKKIRFVSFLGGINPEWISDLLESTTDVRRLEVTFPTLWDNHGENMQLCHSFSRTFRWPNLSYLHLEDVLINHAVFIEFLNAHRDTLEHIFFSSIGFPSGTWLEPIAAISKMSKLSSLFLQLLLEREPYSNSAASPVDLGIDTTSVHVQGIENVSLTLEALENNLITRPVRQYPFWGGEEEFYPHVVDLCKAAVTALYGCYSAEISE